MTMTVIDQGRVRDTFHGQDDLFRSQGNVSCGKCAVAVLVHLLSVVQ